MLLNARHIQRFGSRVAEPNDDGCTEWTGFLNPGGYGCLCMGGRKFLAHRVSWALTYGVMPEAFVLHRCDNCACVNVDHLWLGTQDDNMADMVAKGRSWDQLGRRNGHAKLTEAEVLDIRKAAWAGETQRVIGLRFGITQAHVSAIKLGRNWTHLPSTFAAEDH